MRIRVLSDLHREFGSTEIPSLPADLIILAGDINTKLNALPWVREFCGTTPTAYVCGNHEFYGAQLPKVTERLAAATVGSSIHVLDDSHFEVNDWHVYGCTLWTDLALIEDWQSGAALAWEKMNDYKRIRCSDARYRKLRPTDTRAMHLRSLERMKAFFELHDPARTIVVTHHAPSARSLKAHTTADPIRCAYASNLETFIGHYQPCLWIHGHIHHSSDYLIGKTRVMSNPQGYPESPNPGFDPSLIIELS